MSRTVVKQDLQTEESVSAYMRPFVEGEGSFTTLLKATRLIGDKRLPSELKEIKNPVLVLYGKHDRLVPYKYIEELIKQQKTIKTIISVLSGMLLVLLVLGIWLTFQKPSFLVFIVIPFTFIPLLIFNVVTLKKIKSELHSRENNK